MWQCTGMGSLARAPTVLISRLMASGVKGVFRSAIVECFKKAIPLFRGRNLLAHGTWWEFSADAITVRSGIDWPSEEQHRTFTAPEIQQIATSLNDPEVELWRLPGSRWQSAVGALLDPEQPLLMRQ
jgi:hypothetical protein